MDIDVISVIPKEARYKFFERMIYKNRHVFSDVIIVLTEDFVTGVDHSQDLFNSLIDATYLDYPDKKGDWRNVATNYALKHSKAEFVLFLEPDFFMEDLSAIPMMYDKEDIALGIDIDGRLHPACLLVKRKVLDRTSLDFSADPPEYDHFDKVTEELKEMGNESIMIGDFVHMAGLTHNMRLEAQRLPVNYKSEVYELYRALSQLI